MVVSDSNLTGRTSPVNISVPAGFTFKEFKGNGTVVKPQSNSLVWTPTMRAEGYSPVQLSASASSVELVFDANVSFAH